MKQVEIEALNRAAPKKEKKKQEGVTPSVSKLHAMRLDKDEVLKPRYLILVFKTCYLFPHSY